MTNYLKPVSYEVYFQLALYPDGVKGFQYNNDLDELGNLVTYIQEDEETFTKYVCNDAQASYVVNMYNNHKNIISQNGTYKRELTYEDKGFYTCKVDMLIPCNENINNFLEDEEYLNTILFDMWPLDANGCSCLYINDKKYIIDISISLITDTTNKVELEEEIND